MKQKKWVAYREGDACGVFENRKEAVKWFKKILKQTMEDFENQDKTDEFDYPIETKRLIIEPLNERKTYLGL